MIIGEELLSGVVGSMTGPELEKWQRERPDLAVTEVRLEPEGMRIFYRGPCTSAEVYAAMNVVPPPPPPLPPGGKPGAGLGHTA